MESRAALRAAVRHEREVRELREALAHQAAERLDAGGLFIAVAFGTVDVDVCGLAREFIAAHANAAVHANRNGGAS